MIVVSFVNNITLILIFSLISYAYIVKSNGRIKSSRQMSRVEGIVLTLPEIKSESLFMENVLGLKALSDSKEFDYTLAFSYSSGDFPKVYIKQTEPSIKYQKGDVRCTVITHLTYLLV